MIRFSLSVSHTPWIEARRANLSRMLLDLLPLSKDIPYFCHNKDYRGRPWEDVKQEWAMTAWQWHIKQDVTHCVLLSDDLNVMPNFFKVLDSMVSSAKHQPIGLMSNHPDGPALFEDGHHWYKTDSWLVGPAMCIPRDLLARVVDWYPGFMAGCPTGKDEYGYREFFHDDSAINEFVTRFGPYSLHPLPAPIEHNLTLGRSHDAKPFPPHAAEWISWRRVWHENPGREKFTELPMHVGEQMQAPGMWFGAEEAPMMRVV